jgi:hypothetical protein
VRRATLEGNIPAVALDWRGQLRPPVTAPPFFGMLTSELDDEYLQVVEGHLKELGFRRAS